MVYSAHNFVDKSAVQNVLKFMMNVKKFLAKKIYHLQQTFVVFVNGSLFDVRKKDCNRSNVPIRKPINNVTEINEANVDVDTIA